jgi:hypothetical protein
MFRQNILKKQPIKFIFFLFDIYINAHQKIKNFEESCFQA